MLWKVAQEFCLTECRNSAGVTLCAERSYHGVATHNIWLDLLLVYIYMYVDMK
jgi:hypothetical protein